MCYNYSGDSMNVSTSICFENNKIIFYLSLPSEFYDINEDKYLELDHKIIYVCDSTKIDYNELNWKIDNLKKIIQKSFLIENEINITHDIFVLDSNTLTYEFIKQNKNLELTIHINDFKEIIETLKDNDYPNLKIKFKNSTEEISYKEFYDMYKNLNEIVEFINHYNLSPLEKIMLVYDIVKANKYKTENKNDSSGVSRNLNEIINNDKIVCVGYANLIDFLLNNLGITCGTISLRYKNKENGHRRNYIYLKDDKYDIDGVFFLDATWDSNKNDNYIDNYNYFLKPFNFFRHINPNEFVYSPNKFKILEKRKDELIEYINTLEEFDLIGFGMTLTQLIKEYNPNIGVILSSNSEDKNKIINMVEEIIERYYQTIKESAFKNALYRVRKIEYINGIFRQDLTEEYIDSVCERYYGNNPETRLLKIIGIYDKPTLSTDLETAKAETVEEDMLRMRLLRAIKSEINDTPQNNYIRKM